MKCPEFTIGYIPPSFKKMDLIWNKCGHANLHWLLDNNFVGNYFLVYVIWLSLLWLLPKAQHLHLSWPKTNYYHLYFPLWYYLLKTIIGQFKNFFFISHEIFSSLLIERKNIDHLTSWSNWSSIDICYNVTPISSYQFNF